MALQQHLCSGRASSLSRIKIISQTSDGRKESKPRPPPAEEFAPLAVTFQRRLLVGLTSASLVAVGANFGGVTSFLLGLEPESGRKLKLDVLYPIRGYSRCIDTNYGFEFIYPASWVGDQTLLYRAEERREFESSLDPPPLTGEKSRDRRRKNVNEPVVAFGPPGSSGELNISVIVSPVSAGFKIEVFGGAVEVGEAVVRMVTGSRSQSGVKGELIEASVREDRANDVKYYELEFRAEGTSFQRHNIAVCCVRRGKLYTLNAQAPESAWPEVKPAFYMMAHSFTLTL